MDGDAGATELSTGKIELALACPSINSELGWTTDGNAESTADLLDSAIVLFKLIDG